MGSVLKRIARNVREKQGKSRSRPFGWKELQVKAARAARDKRRADGDYSDVPATPQFVRAGKRKRRKAKGL